MTMLGNNILMGAAGQGGGYTIDRSVRLRSSASAYFSRTFGSPTGTTKGTWSGWVKRGKLGAQQFIWSAANYEWLEFQATDKIRISNPSGTPYWVTTQVFRDPSAWYHIVVAFDTTLATAADRCKLWVNGAQVTQWDASPTITQNATFARWNANSYQGSIGRFDFNNTAHFDGYQTENHWIDGQALDPTSFGEFNEDTGVWQPVKYTGTYGTNGFYLNFSDNTTTTTLGEDGSGNGNDWTPNNISLTSGATYDSMTDTPTPYADGGNYGALNPLDKSLTDGSITNGNLTLNGTSNWNACRGTFGMSSGKWYWETTHSVYNQSLCGIADSVWPPSTYYPGYSTTGYAAAYGQNALKYVDGVNSAYGATFTIGDVIGYALDMDAGTLTCYKNGVSQGEMVSGLTAYGTIFPAIAAANGAVINANFGQRPFAYTPPTGFKALNTFNLPDSDIVNGREYFDVSLYTGNSTARSITNSGAFQPDLVWIKARSAAYGHILQDSVRGVSPTVDNALLTNSTQAELDLNALGGTTTVVTGLNSDGFSLGQDTYYLNGNNSGVSYAAWQWKANGAGASNSDGSITSTVSANPTAGFSIVTYTGTGSAATVGHGLGAAPAMIIVKNRDNGAVSWVVYHKGVDATNPENYMLFLNLTNARSSSSSTGWNSTTPTSSVFSVNAYNNNNQSGSGMVAYCFADVEGYSKFGSYTGNGSADGPFVFTGFRPAFVMIKRTDSTGNWILHDSSRSTSNLINNGLYPNTSDAENSGWAIDFLSNGFKQRTTGTWANTSGATYIYMAFAETDFANSLAR